MLFKNHLQVISDQLFSAEHQSEIKMYGLEGSLNVCLNDVNELIALINFHQPCDCKYTLNKSTC